MVAYGSSPTDTLHTTAVARMEVSYE